MTRRLLLNTNVPAGAPTPPEDEGPPPEPADSIWAGWPTTTDPFLLNLRPQGRRTSLQKVRLPGGTHTSFGAGTQQAVSDAQNDGLSGTLYWDGDGPDYRHDVIVGPGLYNENGGGKLFGCYVGSTGNPEDVIIQSDGGSNGTLHTFGSIYLEGLTFRAYSSDGDLSPKYPWHITGGQSTIAANCIFDVRGAVRGVSQQGGNRTGGLVGKDSSVLTVFYNCKFIGDPVAGIGNFNMHGGAAGRWAETILFYNCETVDMGEIGGTGGLDLQGNRSKLYVIGTTSDGPLTIAADGNTDVFTDSNYPVSGSPVNVTRGVTEPPEIEKGLRPDVFDYFYPSDIGKTNTPDLTPATVGDLAPMAPVPGRQYYTRVRLTKAQKIQWSGFVCTTAAGRFGSIIIPADTPYVQDELPSKSLQGYNVNATVGKVGFNHYFAYSRYPGGNGVWVVNRFESGDIRVEGSASLPGITDCYYTDDGVTWTKVNAGTPHPMVYVNGKKT